ncbi:MAG: hypothetical protein GW865_00225 [Candidatus Aenigmarchaeota archaeon]|nr:hypothetical protein [Candidatus Aenigmarchaeota archaeon]
MLVGLMLVLLMVYFSGCTKTADTQKTPENQAYDAIDNELDQAVDNMDTSDIENSLLD